MKGSDLREGEMFLLYDVCVTFYLTSHSYRSFKSHFTQEEDLGTPPQPSPGAQFLSAFPQSTPFTAPFPTYYRDNQAFVVVFIFLNIALVGSDGTCMELGARLCTQLQSGACHTVGLH